MPTISYMPVYRSASRAFEVGGEGVYEIAGVRGLRDHRILPREDASNYTRDHVCSACWGILIPHGIKEDHWNVRVKCVNCGDDYPGVITTVWRDQLHMKYMQDEIKIRKLYPHLDSRTEEEKRELTKEEIEKIFDTSL